MMPVSLARTCYIYQIKEVDTNHKCLSACPMDRLSQGRIPKIRTPTVTVERLNTMTFQDMPGIEPDWETCF
jgi:hypothetical protein